jgi:hypothetical protein
MTKPAIVDDYYSHINPSDDKASLSSNPGNTPKIRVKIKNVKEELVQKKDETTTIKKETINFKKDETSKKVSISTFSKANEKPKLEKASEDAPKKSFFVKKEDVVAKPVESKKFTPK